MNDQNLNEHVIKEKIIVLDELRDLIPALKEDELNQLEQNILAEGIVRDPIVIWEKEDKLILVDGHNRLEICKRNNLPVPYIYKSFTNVDEVKAWMIDNQTGRRNLTPNELSYFRGLCYTIKKTQTFQEEGWSARLANQFAVSEKTLKRDAEFAKKLNLQPEIKSQILTGKLKVAKSEILQSNKGTSTVPFQKSEVIESAETTSITKFASIAFKYLVNEHRPLGDVINQVDKEMHNKGIGSDDDDYPLHFFLTWYRLKLSEQN